MTRNPTLSGIELALARQIAEKQQRQFINRMAGALCATFQIPEGSRLVPFLTRSTRIRTNHEAVAAWIESQLAEPDLDVSTAVLPILTDMLGRKLRSISEGPSSC